METKAEGMGAEGSDVGLGVREEEKVVVVVTMEESE